MLRFFRIAWAAAECATVHEHHVHRHAMKPSRELRLAAEVLEALVHLNENFLDRVFELGIRQAETEYETGNRRAMARVELAKRNSLACYCTRDQLIVDTSSRGASPGITRMCPVPSGRTTVML